MTGSSKAIDQFFHVRSISLPSTPQPLALRVEEELNKLRTSVPSSTTPEMICKSLRELEYVYDCIQDFLSLPSNQQSLSHPVQGKWVEEELDQSIKLLDLCSSIQDNLVAVKDYAQDLSLALRRNDAVIESKNVQKDIKKSFSSMKQIQSKCRTMLIHEKDYRFSVAVRLLKETKEIVLSLLQAILSSFCIPKTRSNKSKLSFISKVLNHRNVSCDKCDLARQVEELVHMEVGLGCLFRQLVKTRVSLLNISSL